MLCVGITGHRAEALGEKAARSLPARISVVLEAIGTSGRALFERERSAFSAAPPALHFVSAIADGSDQIAAEAALSLGWELQAIASSVIGGTSLFGAIGSVHGPLIGAFILATINNGANLLNVNSFWQQIITGGLIILIVFFDQLRRRNNR